VPKIWGFPLTLIVTLTPVLCTTMLCCDYITTTKLLLEADRLIQYMQNRQTDRQTDRPGSAVAQGRQPVGMEATRAPSGRVFPELASMPDVIHSASKLQRSTTAMSPAIAMKNVRNFSYGWKKK